MTMSEASALKNLIERRYNVPIPPPLRVGGRHWRFSPVEA